jgi:uncharacterized protein YbdZ (MbtH family)
MMSLRCCRRRHTVSSSRNEGCEATTNLFEDEGGRYYVVISDKGQYSLWPAFVDAPEGWTIVHGGESRKPCLDYKVMVEHGKWQKDS